MEIQLILLLITSIILTIFSAWSVSNFFRYGHAISNYTTDNSFELACNMSLTYVRVAKIISLTVFTISLLILLFSMYTIFRLY